MTTCWLYAYRMHASPLMRAYQAFYTLRFFKGYASGSAIYRKVGERAAARALTRTVTDWHKEASASGKLRTDPTCLPTGRELRQVRG